MKRKFIIVGSGWRSLFYVRVAKALTEQFELCAMLCRTEEKAQLIREEWNIHTTTSISECEQYKPDFVVIAVSKDAIFSVTLEWMQKGFVVLSETPAAQELDQLNELWKADQKKGRLCVAEQYLQYPTYKAMQNLLNQGILGKRQTATISVAHDYHGASMIRGMLAIEQEHFKVYGHRYTYPIVETASRYERFYDGRIAEKNRDKVTFEFESGKTGFYDFNSVQYRSEIRSNFINVQGICGELKDYEVSYLDSEFQPHREMLKINHRMCNRDYRNPHQKQIQEIIDVKFENQILYTAPFGLCGLSEDETAIAVMMEGAAQLNAGGQPVYSLANALTDAYMSILMKQALQAPGTVIESEKQIWM